MQAIAATKHWLRFISWRMSLRTLMILVLVVGAWLGRVAMQRQQEARRQWVLATLQGSGASVQYDAEGISQISWVVVPTLKPEPTQLHLKPEQLEALRSLDRLKDLVAYTAVLTDDGLLRLSQAKALQSIYCFQPEITDAGVKHLAGLTHLKKLELLRVPQLTDASLASLAGLGDLESVNLSGAGITGAGFAHLTGMKKLKSLGMPNSSLDDAGMASLAHLTTLKQLYIGGGKYTDAGVENLSKLNELTDLGFGSETNTEACLAHLAGLKNLEILNIYGPHATDEWLDRIARMKSLRQLHIDGGTFSDEAIERIDRALPQTEIYINGQRR